MLLARVLKIRYTANLHDPVRNFVVGPLWWHRLSVRLAYLPLEFVQVHNKLSEPSPVPAGVGIVEVPVGVFEINGVPPDATLIRTQWGVPNGHKVFLAFGYVRDGKNLHLALEALAQVPETFLVIAGSVASTRDRGFDYYRDLAQRLGVSDRCHFAEGFIADDTLGQYFVATDFVLLTYSAAFHSQSGVLSIAARARKPMLASASPSPLIEAVEKFQLGISVEPDSTEAVVSGMNRMLVSPPQPRWQDYEDAVSWSVNARGVMLAAGFITNQNENL